MEPNDGLGLGQSKTDDSLDMEMSGEFKAAVAFVAVLALAMLAGVSYVVYLLLTHFGVIA